MVLCEKMPYGFARSPIEAYDRGKRYYHKRSDRFFGLSRRTWQKFPNSLQPT